MFFNLYMTWKIRFLKSNKVMLINASYLCNHLRFLKTLTCLQQPRKALSPYYGKRMSKWDVATRL